MGKSLGAASTEALKVRIESAPCAPIFFKIGNSFRQEPRFAIKTLLKVNNKTERLCDESPGFFCLVVLRQR